MKKKVGFIGLGLIGGSIAKAIRKIYPHYHMIALDKYRENLALAKEEGVIDLACQKVDANFADCDYIFLCLPVSHNIAYLSQLKTVISKDCILTDVGSVKTPICNEISAHGLDAYFIGGHPMTGSEKSNFANAKALLLENVYYILTPAQKVSSEQIKHFKHFIESLKALPIVLDAQSHDRIVGTISHLPHLIASNLVNFVQGKDNPDEQMKMLAAGGFRDITRIASSNPTMWQQICLENRDNLSEILNDYIALLEQTKNALEYNAKQEVYQIFESSRSYRNSIPNESRGAIKKVHSIYCDLIDEAGGIATIATILASNQINIKNIGIIHNREFEEGVLRIEFYDETSTNKAKNLLEHHRYVIYIHK
ncbi:MAG: prephenate dehydrogenase [Lachnospiraceae bacterium]|nr:prephenate dehydrogenase [Lachnospiraceae bacterium]